MASSVDFVEFVCEQIADVGAVRHKKMFGEYLVYVNEKPVFTICNDTLFAKMVAETTAILGEDAAVGSPYNGAKLHYIVQDPDNQDIMRALAQALERITPLPKPKKKKLS